MKYSGLVYYIILSFVFTFSSCSKDILDPNGFRGKDEIKDNYLVLRDQTIFLSPSEKTEIKSVKKDEVIVNSNGVLSQKIKPGTVLVNSGISAGDSIGFYRRVLTISSVGSDLILTTKNVGLQDAYSKWSIDSRSDKFTIQDRFGEWTDNFSIDAGIAEVTFGGSINPDFDVQMKYKNYYFTSFFDSLLLAQALESGGFVDPTFHLHFEGLQLTVKGSVAVTQSFELASNFNLPTVLISPIAETGLGLYFSPLVSLSGKVTGTFQSAVYEKTVGPYDIDLSYTYGDISPVYTSTLNASLNPEPYQDWALSASGECELQLGAQFFVSVLGGQDLVKSGIGLFNYFTPKITHLGNFTNLQPGYDLTMDIGAGTNFFFDFDLIKDFLSSSWSTDDYKYDLFHLSAIVEPFNPYTSVDLNYNQALQTFTLTVNNDDPSRTFYNILINDVQITDLGNPTFNYNQEYTLNLPLTGDVINKITVKDVFSVGCYLDDVYVDEGAISDCQQSVTDEEGNVYCTVRIGNLNWMAENLRLSTAGSSYDGELNYESRLYGRLYTFDEIMNGYSYSESTSSNVIRGLCPQGWHLPRLAEWNDLANALGGFTVAGKNMKLGSAALWPNSSLPDQNTFNVTPAGEHYIWKSGSSAFGNRKKLSKFWTTRIGLLGEVTIIEINSTNGIGQNYNVNTDPTYYSSVKSIGYSCRCVED